MSYQFPFEKLEVWQLSFGLISQITRAAVSVASTIAEGSARTSKKDQAHFSQIAYGSLMEVACQIMIAHELEYLDAKIYGQLRKNIDRIGNKLNSLRKYQINNFNNRFNDSTIQQFNK